MVLFFAIIFLLYVIASVLKRDYEDNVNQDLEKSISHDFGLNLNGTAPQVPLVDQRQVPRARPANSRAAVPVNVRPRQQVQPQRPNAARGGNTNEYANLDTQASKTLEKEFGVMCQ